MKLAFLSHVLPPSWSGQAMMLYRLLDGLNAEDYCLISRQYYDVNDNLNSHSNRLPGKYYCLQPEFRLRGGSRLRLARLSRTTNILLSVVLRSRQVANIAKHEMCTAIVACTGDLTDPFAGYLASRLLGIPFFPYFFDYYSYQWFDPVDRYFAQRFESHLLRGAADIIVPNEFLRNELLNRYGVSASVIHNPCDVSEINVGFNATRNSPLDGFAIVYTGAVYHANHDAFRNLIAAIGQLEQQDITLHIYTGQSVSDLFQHGICGPVKHHPHLAPSQATEVQQNADILFLPLGFHSPIPEVIRTSAPGKMGEYLASGKPVLVHAPADSYASWYFRKYRCGLVVDQDDPALLANALQTLIGNSDLRDELVRNARVRATSDFDVSVVRDKFLSLLQTGNGV